jgi:hypothetical protein
MRAAVARSDFPFYGQYRKIRAGRQNVFSFFHNPKMALLSEADVVFKAKCSLTREQRSSHTLNCRMHAAQFLDVEENDKDGMMQTSRSTVSGPIPTSFDLMTHAVSLSSEVSSLSCPECEVPLDLHQPDDNQPTQLLGICCACNRWYFLVETESDWTGALLFELPSADEIRGMIGVSAAAVV